MSDVEYDDLLTMLVEAGCPGPLAKRFAWAIKSKPEAQRRQLLEEVRLNPQALRTSIRITILVRAAIVARSLRSG